MKIFAGALIASATASEFTGSCGGTITGSTTIVSPVQETGFDAGKYYNNLACVWNIDLDPSVSSFDLVASRFEVEYNAGCKYDHLEILDAEGELTYICGPDNSRRKRDADKPVYKEISLLRSAPVNTTINSGLTTHTVFGNQATISFITDHSIVETGFEIEIIPGYSEEVSGEGSGETPAALTPVLAWEQIEAAAADIATRVNDFYAALPGLGANSILASKKVARFNAFFDKMDKLYGLSSADACEFPAGSNDHAAFLAPVDSEDACEELQGLFASLASFTDAFVCLENAEASPDRLSNLIQRQRKQIITRKLKQMKCGNN